jgi:hypothetical protein
MALTERTEIDKVEVTGQFKHIQLRTATVIERDGVEISRTFHRHVLAPDCDACDESKEVQAVCAIYHTPAVKKAYAAHLKANMLTLEAGI